MILKDVVSKNRWILLGLCVGLIYGLAMRIASRFHWWNSGLGVMAAAFIFATPFVMGFITRLHFGAPETASSLDVVCSTVALDDWRRDWRFDYTVRRLHLHCDVFADWNGVCHDRRRDRGVARPVFKAEALERNNRGLRRISSSAHRSMGAERSLREGDTQCEHFY